MFKRYEHNPVISPDITKSYEKECTYNPAAMVHEGKIYVMYRAEGEAGEYISRLCLAVSEDGLHFEKYEGNPVIEPTLPEEKRGCEDPRLTRIGDTFYLTYTAFEGVSPETGEKVYTALATSKNMVHWEKRGMLFEGIKAAAIFPEKVKGKYFMVIGGKKIHVATSTDLTKWELEEDPILDTREGKFDSQYVEVGPPPFVYKDKFVLFFNTADKKKVFHPSLALLDRENPRNVLYRADEPLMTPTEEYETSGKVNNVIFGSGLVEFHGTYFYYYGTADKYVCVATITKKELEDRLSRL